MRIGNRQLDDCRLGLVGREPLLSDSLGTVDTKVFPRWAGRRRAVGPEGVRDARSASGFLCLLLSVLLASCASETIDGRNYEHFAFPLNTPYGQLTPAQKNGVRALFVDLDPNDEPPFPLGGLNDLYRPIWVGQQKLLVSGEFVGFAEVDQEGFVSSIAVLKTPNDRATKFVSELVVLTKFKPAVCKGQRCSMGFPIRVTFKVE
jgi:hypothetical protein